MIMRYFLLVMCVLVVTTITAQTQSDKFSIHFKTGTVQPEQNGSAYLSSYKASDETFFGGQFFKIIQFFEIPDVAEKTVLKYAGVTLLDYLPHRAYFASFQTDLQIDELMQMGIRSIMDVDVDYKLSPNLYKGNIPDHAILENGSISVLVNYYPNLDPDQVTGALQAAGFPVIMRNDFGHFINVIVAANEIRTVAALPFIVFMEPVNPEPEPENSTGRTLHRNNAIATDYGAGRHYDGSGVHVELQDDGLIGPHIDYQGRIGAQFVSSNFGNHGDHCAGIIMAAGNVDPLGKGQAFGAELYVYRAAPAYPGFNAIPQDYGTLEIRITSTSYSDGCNAGYTSLTRTLDQQVRMYPSLMHVFSAGNNGNSNCGYGAGAGWGNVTGGHKIGKNVIAVANVDFLDNLRTSSSRGPAHDGRIKPDLAAKGTSVYSTINPNTYSLKSGTSMSCPGVAGTLAQLFQAYRELYNGTDPMAGLMKGILLNTAEDLGNPGPDFKFGWGRINALRAVQVIEEARFDSGTLDQGGTITHFFDVPANVAQLRVMVYWTDYEASVNTDWALVNNLDMTLTDPSSTTWNPWVLSHYPHPDSLNMPAVRRVDNRNNMEQVTLDDPAAGTYTLYVEGVTIPQGPQTYYVVYEFIPDDVVLTYPIGGESLVPGESELIRWDAFGVNELFTLEFSLDNGQSWETIAEDIPGGDRGYSWQIPIDISGEGLVRITAGGISSQSEAPFSIFGIPCNIQIDWACEDAIHLSWGEIVGATSYEVFKLGEKYMESAGITSLNSFILEDTSITDQSWFSVRALGENGAAGRRAIAIQKDPGTYNCYPADAMMMAIPSVDWGLFQTYMDLSGIPVSVEVKNFGTEPVTDPDLSFQLDNGTVYTETYSGTIDPDSSLQYTFVDQIDISDTGSYILKAWITYAPDQNPDNDQIDFPIEVIEGGAVSFGYMQTFDTWPKCASAPICELYTCDLEEGWANLANEVYDQHDWRTYGGSTNTGWTGPSFDHTTGTYTGYYLYMEPSISCFNKTAIINTPCLDLTNGVSPTLSIWYHAYGADIGWFHVDLFAGSEIVRDVVPPVIGNQGDEWRELEIDLSPWVGQIVGLRFRGMTSCDQAGDFAIDDVSLTDITPVDQGQRGISNQLLVYPNPASGQVTILLKGAGKHPYTLHIVDLYGRTIYLQVIETTGDKIQEVIDFSDLATGMYLVQVVGNSEAHQAKLTIR